MMAASAPIESMSPWRQNAEGDMYQVNRPRPSTTRHRPVTTSPRYVRTWSQEEEAHLLEARRARVPYKDIAARLNKTDLACRLHYHQMVNARKNSIPEESMAATPSEQYNASIPYHHRSESLPPITTAVQSQILLPAPIIREVSRPSSGAVSLNSNSHRRTNSQPQTAGKRQTTSSPPLGGISKQSSAYSNSRRLNSANGSVDINRVQEIYRDLAPSFWSNIASRYSQDKSISPSDVETAFFRGQGFGAPQPETVSPDSSTGSWPSAMSSISSAASQMSCEDRTYPPSDPMSIDGNKTKCSLGHLLNN